MSSCANDKVLALIRQWSTGDSETRMMIHRLNSDRPEHRIDLRPGFLSVIHRVSARKRRNISRFGFFSVVRREGWVCGQHLGEPSSHGLTCGVREDKDRPGQHALFLFSSGVLCG